LIITEIGFVTLRIFRNKAFLKTKSIQKIKNMKIVPVKINRNSLKL
ncbi:MAG: hypothetical protein ACI9JT_001649, partial [Polaribacter sp.]